MDVKGCSGGGRMTYEQRLVTGRDAYAGRGGELIAPRFPSPGAVQLGAGPTGGPNAGMGRRKNRKGTWRGARREWADGKPSTRGVWSAARGASKGRRVWSVVDLGGNRKNSRYGAGRGQAPRPYAPAVAASPRAWGWPPGWRSGPLAPLKWSSRSGSAHDGHDSTGQGGACGVPSPRRARGEFIKALRRPAPGRGPCAPAAARPASRTSFASTSRPAGPSVVVARCTCKARPEPTPPPPPPPPTITDGRRHRRWLLEPRPQLEYGQPASATLLGYACVPRTAMYLGTSSPALQSTCNGYSRLFGQLESPHAMGRQADQASRRPRHSFPLATPACI
ncbi:hypothetical protein BDY21DRAFT_417947 [Lineolata rhizophorae]|uniref:Uncharacterized protein n=1 Tax=Lineolata rhizophorae TaxID=578093 RepID=A0A6A6PDV0_9PEZI|nr:hypothetical protein BDY21DRAFT_417947 [Lineolata rhizophorae]